MPQANLGLWDGIPLGLAEEGGVCRMDGIDRIDRIDGIDGIDGIGGRRGKAQNGLDGPD